MGRVVKFRAYQGSLLNSQQVAERIRPDVEAMHRRRYRDDAIDRYMRAERRMLVLLSALLLTSAAVMVGVLVWMVW